MNEATATQILMVIAGAAGSLLISGVAYLVSRAWKPVEGIEDIKLRQSRMEDRLSAGGSTFAEIKTELKELKIAIQNVELEVARLLARIDGSGIFKIIREEEDK